MTFDRQVKVSLTDAEIAGLLHLSLSPGYLSNGEKTNTGIPRSCVGRPSPLGF